MIEIAHTNGRFQLWNSRTFSMLNLQSNIATGRFITYRQFCQGVQAWLFRHWLLKYGVWTFCFSNCTRLWIFQHVSGRNTKCLVTTKAIQFLKLQWCYGISHSQFSSVYGDFAFTVNNSQYHFCIWQQYYKIWKLQPSGGCHLMIPPLLRQSLAAFNFPCHFCIWHPWYAASYVE